MQTVYYVLASVAAVAVAVGAITLTFRALLLMARIEHSRRDLARTIGEVSLSLQHANRLMARVQEGMDHLRHTMDRLERVLDVLQPATTVGGLLAGAKRALSGRRAADAAPAESGKEQTNGRSG